MKFSTVTRFVEQVGRRREHRKPSELDTLDTMFIGPGPIASNVCPGDLAQHPVFSGMRCVGWRVLDMHSSLAEVQATYAGKLDGSNDTLANALITTSTREGSISWSTYVGAITRQLSPAYNIPGSWNNGMTIVGASHFPGTFATAYLTLTYLCRFATQSVVRTYLIRGQPSIANPPTFTFNGPANSLPSSTSTAGVLSSCVFITSSSKTNDQFGLVTAKLVFLSETDVTTKDRGDGWIEVQEETNVRPYINTVVDQQWLTGS